MQKTPVQSSTIAHIGYDPDKSLLEIGFKSGGTYHYEDVPQDAYDAFEGAGSHGKHFHANIRGQYSEKKV